MPKGCDSSRNRFVFSFATLLDRGPVKCMFRCSYILDGTGWATVSVSENDRQVDMTASYLHDSLRELSQAALDLCDGNSAVTVVFMDEPGEHHLVVTGSQNSATVDIEV